MIILISIPNIVSLLLGWDGLGITSFLLIIYYQNPKSLGAGIFTFMSNRLGDALIIVAITISLYQGHWNLSHIWLDSLNSWIVIFLIIGAITKSAQIPFSRWLPAAIAAPTPVSALVHSSTLVTAGIYLLIRFYPMLASSSLSMTLLIYLSILTTLIAGLAALFETDIKKIIALSTLSQLGLIITSISLTIPTIAFFHLITHAMFKALLFISAGTLIHTFINSQDLRLLGTVSNSIPLTSAAINTANIALSGLPFLRGFYSKDLIIEMTITESSRFWILFITSISTALTAAYSMRLSYYTLWSPVRHSPLILKSDNLQNNYTNPIITLSFFAITTGAAINWLYVTPLIINPLISCLKLLALIFSLSGLLMFSPYFLKFFIHPSSSFINFSNTFITIWFLTHLSTQGISRPLTKLNSHLLPSLDHGWNELLGPQGIFITIKPFLKLSSFTRFQSSSLIVMAPLRFILISLLIF